MRHLATTAVLPHSERTLRSQFGNQLATSDVVTNQFGPLSYWLASQVCFANSIELQCAEIVRTIGDVGDVYCRACYVDFDGTPIRTGVGWFVKLKASIVEMDALMVSGRKLYNGYDFYVRDGGVHFLDRDLPLGSVGGVSAEGVVFRTFNQEYLFSAMFNFSDFTSGSRRFYAAMHKSLRDGVTKPMLAELVTAAVGGQSVSKPGVVLEVVERVGFSPVVVTTAETVLGLPDDTAIVSVGDKVSPGDLLFSSVQIWDCSDPPPPYLSQLVIPPDCLHPSVGSPITVSATPATPTFILADGRYHTRYPITGDASAVAKYWEAQDAMEVATGFYLSEYLASSKIVPVAGLSARQYNWIEVLWETWLRFGAIVVRVMYPDSRSVTDLQRQRLKQIRRSVPPWMVLIIQANVSPEHAC